jgi:hypothetical protein
VEVDAPSWQQVIRVATSTGTTATVTPIAFAPPWLKPIKITPMEKRSRTSLTLFVTSSLWLP